MKYIKYICFSFIIYFISLFFNNEVFALSGNASDLHLIDTDYGVFEYKQQDLIDIDSTCTNGFVIITDTDIAGELYVYYFSGSVKFDIVNYVVNITNISPRYRYYKRFVYNFETDSYRRINNQNNVNGNLNINIEHEIYASFNNYVFQPYGLPIIRQDLESPYVINSIDYNVYPFNIREIPYLTITDTSPRFILYQFDDRYTAISNFVDVSSYITYYNDFTLYDLQTTPYLNIFYNVGGSSTSSIFGYNNFTYYYNTSDGYLYNSSNNSRLWSVSLSNLKSYLNYDLLDQNGNILRTANVENHAPIDLKTVDVRQDLGDNTYGYFTNYLTIHNFGTANIVYNYAINCEQDKPFLNGYCIMDYNDMQDYNSNINLFRKSAFGFTQLFGVNNNLLKNDRYYLYSFRILKPFVPEVSALVIDTDVGEYDVSARDDTIISVKKVDGVGYTDYVIQFKITNSNFDEFTSIKSIFVLFAYDLDYYYDVIPQSFQYGVYRSFKIKYSDTIFSNTDINNFTFDNDLSNIDGTSHQNNFFTDTYFDTHGFSGIITAPFRFLYAMEVTDYCEPIEFQFPHSSSSFTLPCVRGSIPDSISPLINILQLILSGFICYRIAVGVLATIKGVLTPTKDGIEVVDL